MGSAATARGEGEETRESRIFDRCFGFLLAGWLVTSLVWCWLGGGFDAEGSTGGERVLVSLVTLVSIGFYSAIPFSILCWALVGLDQWRESRWRERPANLAERQLREERWREADERRVAERGEARWDKSSPRAG